MGRALTCVAAGALVWAAWLSWGADGRYAPWQVVGCALTAAVVVAAASRGLDRGVAAASVALPTAAGFTAAWTWWASRSDQTGTFLVGTLLVALGTVAGLAVVAVLASGSRGHQRS